MCTTSIEATLSRAFRRTSDATEVNIWSKSSTPRPRRVRHKTARLPCSAQCCVASTGWYVTEQGEPEPGSSGVVRLSRYEVADQLSFVMRGEGADAALLADVEEMYDPDVRRAHARRLLSDVNARQHYREFVLQWLEVD